MNPPTLYLMLGYPGSGKTTASKLLHQITGAEHLWADHERKKRFAVPSYTHAENLKLYAELNAMAGRLLAEGKSVIFDTNFNFFSDRQKLRRIAAKYNAPVIVVWVVAPKAVARERATQDAHRQETRILGDMTVANFERMSKNLQPPRAGETVVQLDGEGMTAETVAAALKKQQT